MPNLSDLADRLNDCRYKIFFLIDAFSQQNEDFEFSENGLAGFYLILRNIEEEMEGISAGIIRTEEVPS